MLEPVLGETGLSNKARVDGRDSSGGQTQLRLSGAPAVPFGAATWGDHQPKRIPMTPCEAMIFAGNSIPALSSAGAIPLLRPYRDWVFRKEWPKLLPTDRDGMIT